MLAWIGRGLLKFFDREERLTGAVAVLAGGALVLLLYTVPVLGFLVYNILGFLAFGAVVYTLLLAGEGTAREHAAAGDSAAGVCGGGWTKRLRSVARLTQADRATPQARAGAATSAFTGSAAWRCARRIHCALGRPVHGDAPAQRCRTQRARPGAPGAGVGAAAPPCRLLRAPCPV